MTIETCVGIHEYMQTKWFPESGKALVAWLRSLPCPRGTKRKWGVTPKRAKVQGRMVDHQITSMMHQVAIPKEQLQYEKLDPVWVSGCQILLKRAGWTQNTSRTLLERLRPETLACVEFFTRLGYVPHKAQVSVSSPDQRMSTNLDQVWWHPQRRHFLVVELKVDTIGRPETLFRAAHKHMRGEYQRIPDSLFNRAQIQVGLGVWLWHQEHPEPVHGCVLRVHEKKTTPYPLEPWVLSHFLNRPGEKKTFPVRPSHFSPASSSSSSSNKMDAEVAADVVAVAPERSKRKEPSSKGGGGGTRHAAGSHKKGKTLPVAAPVEEEVKSHAEDAVAPPPVHAQGVHTESSAIAVPAPSLSVKSKLPSSSSSGSRDKGEDKQDMGSDLVEELLQSPPRKKRPPPHPPLSSPDAAMATPSVAHPPPSNAVAASSDGKEAIGDHPLDSIPAFSLAIDKFKPLPTEAHRLPQDPWNVLAATLVQDFAECLDKYQSKRSARASKLIRESCLMAPQIAELATNMKTISDYLDVGNLNPIIRDHARRVRSVVETLNLMDSRLTAGLQHLEERIRDPMKVSSSSSSSLSRPNRSNGTKK